VGFHTIINAQIIYKSIKVNEHIRRLGLPVSLTLNAAGVIAPLRNLTNPQVGVYRGSVKGVIRRFKAFKEQIYSF
jgi:hypothetical protein